jgi:hypothetical protein
MYRQIVTPSEQNSIISFSVPNEWYGQEVEIIAFPVVASNNRLQQSTARSDRRKKREKLLSKYLVDLSNFKFNRDELNDYE